MKTNRLIKRLTNRFQSTMIRQAPSDLKFQLEGPVLMMWLEPSSLGVPACSIKTRTSIKTAAVNTAFIPITQTRGHLHLQSWSSIQVSLTAAQHQNWQKLLFDSVSRWSEKVLFSSPFLVNGAVKQARMPTEGAHVFGSVAFFFPLPVYLEHVLMLGFFFCQCAAVAPPTQSSKFKKS